MKKKSKKENDDIYKEHDPNDPDCPQGELVEIPNFLPPPDQLVLTGDDTEKITIVLKKSSVDFFRRQARKQHTKYQKMIRAVLDRYVSNYKAA